MSDLGLRMESDQPRSRRRGKDTNSRGGGRRRGRKKKNRGGCAVFLAFALVIALLGAGGWWAYGFVKDRFGPPPDYSGAGTSETVVVQIQPGWAPPQMANALKKAGVVKSVEAFTKVAREDPDQRSTKIQPGAYVMKKKMSAKAAYERLIDPKNKSDLIIPPGTRASRVYELIAKRLEVPKEEVEAAAKDPSLGLPDYANGNIEGFLYPASYNAAPGMKPVEVLKEMVGNAVKEYEDDDLAGRAKELGREPYDIIIIASLIEAEAKNADDRSLVSEVIYNRLRKNMSLGLDSTVNYYLNKSSINLTNKELNDKDNPYNTRVHKGLPPGPIGNPGHDSIEAALSPAEGNYLYFVTVNPVTGETKFTASDAEFQKFVQEFREWQKENPGQ